MLEMGIGRHVHLEWMGDLPKERPESSLYMPVATSKSDLAWIGLRQCAVPTRVTCELTHYHIRLRQ